MEDKSIDVFWLIKQSIDEVEDSKVRNCVRNGREAIEK
jgi:hypothetical protein